MFIFDDAARLPSVHLGVLRGFFGEMRFLSNFEPCSVDIGDGLSYPSSEHAYMAQKTKSLSVRHIIAALPSAAKARRYGVSMPLREDWDSIRIEAMRKALRAKFSAANPSLALRLVSTYPLALEETNNWGDRFWGVCLGEGRSELGKLLMERRGELIEEGFPLPSDAPVVYRARHSENLSDLPVRWSSRSGFFTEREPSKRREIFTDDFPGGPLRHYKGGLYDGLCPVFMGDELLFLYRAKKDGGLWLRPIDMFFERTSDGTRRFESNR